MKVSIQVTGKLSKMKVDQEVYKSTQGFLREIGGKVVTAMKEYTSPHDWKGKLSDSIMWRTQNAMSSAGESTIDAPDDINSVDIGSASSYAYFREFGAGPHLSKAGSEEFIANMKEWFKDKVGGDPDTDPDAKSHLYAIINKIREGQDAVPFAQPAMAAFPLGSARGAAERAINVLWGG